MVDLEMDELNQHECMATLTGLIGHMQRNNITPKIDEVSCREAERSRFLLCIFDLNGRFHYLNVNGFK